MLVARPLASLRLLPASQASISALLRELLLHPSHGMATAAMSSSHVLSSHLQRSVYVNATSIRCSRAGTRCQRITPCDFPFRGAERSDAGTCVAATFHLNQEKSIVLRSSLTNSASLRMLRCSSQPASSTVAFSTRVNRRFSASAGTTPDAPAGESTKSESTEDGAGNLTPQEVQRTAAQGESTNGATTAGTTDVELPSGELVLPKLGMWMTWLVKWRMLTAWPWQRVKKGSVFALKISGAVGEQLGSPFSSNLALPQVCENLRKAAVDPRIGALVLKVEPVQMGWGKVEEIRRHVLLFRKSGKPCMAYMSVGGEKEYYLASACEEIFATPEAYVSLRGLSVQGQFLGGVLEKAGVEPQIQRIGKYKSAGDQLARKDMSEANREMLTALLDDIYAKWRSTIAAARGKKPEDVDALLEEGVVGVQKLQEMGWIDRLMYESEVETMLKEKLGQPKDKPLRSVDNRKYSKVQEKTLGIGGRGDRIAVIRAVGAIARGKGGGAMGGVRSEDFIALVRKVKGMKNIKAVVLRIDSPGGDALASDIMWQEIRELAKLKPVVATMSDVAASGGYYMAMACPVIVSEALTLTGSIGVVTGKFNLASLYNRIGFSKEIISRGKFAEVDADQRPFTAEEEEYFARGARHAYSSFRNKAALSRNMEVDKMEQFAQGRVWSGEAAKQWGLVDAVGGLSRAVAIAKQRAGIPEEKRVRLVEFSRQKPSPLALIRQSLSAATLLTSLTHPSGRKAMMESLVADYFASDEEHSSLGEPQTRLDSYWLESIGLGPSSVSGLPAGAVSSVLALVGQTLKNGSSR
eukprot:TRINITY_DN3502_c0_g1_i1.p1 TRINITY_DN3502_c0_g1~~TRINITY_DN3502_c0_g1_i1.p1  ORF type:complete len:807 (-),score=143.61 TRINITY_DN3502_c0_g1_i1:294-2714(-)